MGMSSSIKLAHFGRKSGKRFETRVWFVEIDGHLWVGSQDVARNWVRNVEASARAELDLGDGPIVYKATRRHDSADIERFRVAVLRKYPIQARFILFFTRGKTAGCFHLEQI